MPPEYGEWRPLQRPSIDTPDTSAMACSCHIGSWSSGAAAFFDNQCRNALANLLVESFCCETPIELLSVILWDRSHIIIIVRDWRRIGIDFPPRCFISRHAR